MLSLTPPQYQVGRVVLFPDSADPSQFYYLPGTPRIASDELGKPAISLLVFKENLDELPDGTEDAVGFLSIDVDCGFSTEELEAARAFLRRELDLPDSPKLVPVFFRHGAAKLLLLDAKSPEQGHEREAATDFVPKILGTASPSLYGDNRAIFQAKLSKKGATALLGSIDGFAPIGVVFELAFAGLQPAYHIKLKADWSKVYHHLSEREEARAPLSLYSNDQSKVLDELLESRMIEVVDTIEGVDEEGMKADHDALMTELRRFMLETFFTLTFDKAMSAGHDIGGEVANVGRGLLSGLFTSILGGYAYVKKDITETMLRSLDVDWSTRKAVERMVYPQAHFATLLRGVRREDLVRVVSGDDELWRTIELDVSALTSWEHDGIAAVGVDVEYGDPEGGDPKRWSLVLDKATPRQKKRAWLDPRVGGKLRYRYEVVFAADGPWGADTKLASDWQEHDGTVLGIRPDTLYRTIDVELSAAPNYPFERFPAVQAWLRYEDPAAGFSHVVDAVLTSERKKVELRFRAPLPLPPAEPPPADPPAPPSLDLRLRHLGLGGAQVDTGWFALEGSAWVVTDPQPGKLGITVIPSGDRTKITNLVVDFEYRDDAANRFDTGQLVFDTTTLGKPQTWSLPLVDPRKRRYRYKLTLVTTAGDFLQTGWIESESPTLPVGELYVRLLEVEVTLAGRAEGVERVRVDLAYDDDPGGVHEQKTVTLTAPGDTGSFQVKLKDATRQEYRYTVTWVTTDGFDRRLGPVLTSDRFVVVPAHPPE